MKVALVHDYLREYGGAERVLEVLHEIFPGAPVYTAYYNPEGLGINAERIKKWDIRPSWFQHMPFGNKLLSPFRIFARKMFESFDLSEYDLVISSSSATHLSKSVLTKPKTLHLSYIHTPPRFLYGYTTSFNYKKHWYTRIGGEIINHFMRIDDFEVSQRPDILIANSKNIAGRIKKFYRRDSVVIFPPIDISEFNLKKQKSEYFLALNRLVRGKGTEVIIEACTKLNLPLKVVGTGPEMEDLKKIAGKNVEFLGFVTDRERVKLYSEAKALIVASEDEDFGITPVEAQAAGAPVIAVRAGGFMETVVPGKTGEFFDEATVESLTKVMENFDPKKYKPEDCRKQAEKFSKENFKKEILKLVEENFPKKS
jgi:glycosyltransferase involved in cell wall biosynthesis